MWKNGWGNGKKYPWAESGLYVLICVGEREKKLTALKLLQSFLRHIKKLNPQFEKDFKNAKFLTKTSFSFTLETVFKMVKKTEETWNAYVQE